MKSDSARYLVVGNSTAAVAAVEGIRSLDTSGRIVLVSREPEHTYSRPLISYLLGGKVDAARLDYRPRDFYAAGGVEARLGVEATGLDASARVLSTSDGEIAFEKLLVATGGSPVVPEVEGGDLGGVFTFAGLDDVRAIDAFVAGGGVRRALVVGSGMIGVKAAEALSARGLGCVVVELAPRVMPLALDETASRLAAEELERHGLELHCGTTVESLSGRDGRVSGAKLRDGASVDCQMVVWAIGVRPNVELVRGTPVRVGKGIAVDEHMETSVPGVYAAGDVAQVRDLITGEARPIPIFPNASRQGRIAGRNMAGAAECYDGGLAMNAVAVFDLPTISAGLISPPAGDASCEEIVGRRRGPGYHRKLVIRDGRIVGAVLVGDIERAGLFTGLMRGAIDVSAVKDLLLTEAFGVLSLPAEYRKHVVSGAGIEV